MNCNSSTWGQGCEPGWAASTLGTFNVTSDYIPARATEPLPCCDGFFCPRGLSCMITCPLGAYCPSATLNEATGLCDPYGYPSTQLNAAVQLNILTQCGGADIWADVTTSKTIFCPAGMYCPTSIEANNCSSGHYCRLGSTYQSSCSHLTSCSDENLVQENLTAVGGLIIVVLTMTLLAVFTCSDWLMDIRKRRKTKARQVAQQQAREHISSLERWKQAKETAKRGATHLTRKLSRSLSSRMRRPSYSMDISQNLSMYGIMPQLNDPEHMGIAINIINENGSMTGFPLNVPLVPYLGDSSDALDLYAPMPIPPVEIPEADESVRKSKDWKSKGKQSPAHTNPTRDSQSEIFAYAYGQLEKERAFGLKQESPTLQETDGYPGQVIGKMRPPIELTFVDLSLYLLGSGKKILSNVTGKFSPGRITAVMGPSGAGKTTFLNALAGKVSHSRLTGVVFINGKPGSIQSYKRIIGFVPQDDIVHGSLTVEENLWFSASYRLPVDMPKCDRVLVVERIIAALGLGAIRDSRVGTVEKRGISGGQRKRVNVGLEMVMEPSLLILDEPTSGLDSTSSRLVLQALRREANVGVNVGVVLHQPSYGLFKMFDDVMFLAKGGRTVYVGPVDEVEEYFVGLGLVVPERINPPDHYMDVLEGIVTPSDQPDFNAKSLPVLWMIHKGYNIPAELMATAADLQADLGRRDRRRSKEPTKLVEKTTTFAQEVLEDLQIFVATRLHMLRTAITKVEEKSGRQTPGAYAQFAIIFRRVAKQRFRESRIQFQDYIILLMAGACVGVLSNMDDTNLGAGGYFYTLIALALLVMIASLRTFSQDKLQFWRESASGINRVAYFVAKDMVDLFNVIIKPLIYLSMFYFFSNPRSTFISNFIVTMVLVYCVTGIAYICAILLQPAPAQLWSVFLPILATLIVAAKRTGFLHSLTYLSYARYANEAYVIANAQRYKGVWLITRCAVLNSQGYRLGDWTLCLVILALYGAVARIVALLCLFFSDRSRQK
ncbi:hypothetical protein CY35_13G024500 [Sphagnum magellanicum]|nr:hypothetical protein CY35_13G024500 [Sphagnum magellanicum]KAH9542766.1 hypothetical protein CY35_13G024500 [Sphagnum magellanicum]